jgi:hypothetical protein
MHASGMAVSGRAFDDDLRFSKVRRLPSASDPKRIELRRKLSHFLTDPFHTCSV